MPMRLLLLDRDVWGRGDRGKGEGLCGVIWALASGKEKGVSWGDRTGKEGKDGVIQYPG